METTYLSFPDGVGGKESLYQSRRSKRYGFKPWVGKIPWRRAWQPIPVFLPGGSHGQTSLAGCSPWGSPGRNTGVGSLSLLQGVFPTQGSNPGLPRCRRILHQLSHQGSPVIHNLLSIHHHNLSWGTASPCGLPSVLVNPTEDRRVSVLKAYTSPCVP